VDQQALSLCLHNVSYDGHKHAASSYCMAQEVAQHHF
jgi:hypothetical protein